MNRSVLLLLSLFIGIGASAQFSLAWQKPLGLSRDTMEYRNLTCVQDIDGAHFVGYEVRMQDKIYPGLSFISSDDSIHRFNNFGGNDGIDGYRIVSFVKSAGDTLFALCNDQEERNGRIIHHPAMMKFTFRDNNLSFLDYYHVNLSDTAGMTDVRIVDGISAGKGSYYMAIAFSKPGSDFVNVYFCQNDRVKASQSVLNATGTKLWWGDDQNLVLSAELPFSSGNSKKFYQIQVLNEKMELARAYPETFQYLDSNASDRLVTLSYRSTYHLGMVARQVRDLAGANRLNWFGFNGFPNGSYNKLIGEDKNLLIVESTVHPKNEEILYNYFYPGSGMNNWVVSRQPRSDLAYDNLILSVENYDGLELARDTFGKAPDNIIDNALTHPELLKNVGTGDIDQHYPAAFCFTNNTSPELYVVYNKPRKTLERAGIYVSKFSLNTADDRFNTDYLSTKYGRSIYYATKPIPATDTRKWLLVALAPDDPLYGQLVPTTDPIKLESALTPIQNTWYWSGDIKVGKRKYHISKGVFALAN